MLNSNLLTACNWSTMPFLETRPSKMGPDRHPASGRGAIWAPRRLRPRGPDRHPVSAKRRSGPRRLGPQSSGARSFSNLEHLLHHTRPKQALAQPHIFKQPFCWVSGDVCWCRFVSVSICCCPEMTGGGFWEHNNGVYVRLWGLDASKGVYEGLGLVCWSKCFILKKLRKAKIHTLDTFEHQNTETAL